MSETAVTRPPELKLPERPSFMVVDGETYFVEKVAQSPVSLLKNVEEYYEANLAVLKQKVSRHVSDESAADLDRQVTRIERHQNAGVVVLPDRIRDIGNGQVLFLWNNKVHETRIVLFRPTRISVVVDRVKEWVTWVKTGISRKDAERYTKFMTWAEPLVQHYIDRKLSLSGTKVDITVEQDLVIEPLVVSFVALENRIEVRPLGKHCHAHGDGHLCTGNTAVADFWNDPQFLSNFNSINPHSFANRATRAAERLHEMLKNQYFISGEIRGDQGGAWRVS